MDGTTSRKRARWSAPIAIGLLALGSVAISHSWASATKSSGARPVLVPIEPCRRVDTRGGGQIGGQGTLQPNSTVTLAVHGTNGECTIPNDANAISMNATSVGASAATYLTIWGEGPMPNASSLNPAPGQPPTPNAVMTPLSVGGTFNVYNFDGTVDVIFDINGYYVDHDHDDRYTGGGGSATGPFTGADIVDGSLTGADVGKDSLDGHVVDDLTGADIRYESLDGVHIENGTIRKVDIAADAIDGSKVSNGTLTGSDIQNGTVWSQDMANETGGTWTQNSGTYDLSPYAVNASRVLLSRTLYMPADGLVIATASGTFGLDSTDYDKATCSISRNTSIMGTMTVTADDGGNVNLRSSVPFSQTVGFQRWSGTPTTDNYSLVCARNAGQVTVSDYALTLIYLPTAY